MRELRATFSKYLVCAVAVGVASGFGWSDKALAQADLNIQSRLQTYAIPLAPTVSDILKPIDNFGACLGDKAFIELLYKDSHLLTQSAITKYFPDLEHLKPGQTFFSALDTALTDPANKQKAADILATFSAIQPTCLD